MGTGFRSVVYSMAGSLWQQKLDSSVAEQLTSGSGYDYQPDCSSDGRWVVYATYARDAVELWSLNLDTKATRQLTTGGAVNVEPRFSPDGKRIAFVSTSFNGHFHIFLGRFSDGELKDVQRLTGENRSNLPVTTIANSTMRSAQPGRRTEKNFSSSPIAGTSTAPAASGG